MKKFKFNLEVILKLKENEEEESRIKLGQITAESERLRNLILSHTNILRTTGIDSSTEDYYAVELYKNRIANEIEKFTEALNKNEEKRERAKNEYIEALSQLNIYQKLKDKKFKEYKKQLAKEEMKFHDEMNQANRFRREFSYGT